MYSIFRKEINSFFSSLIGYLVIAVFLTTNGLFLWVVPGNLNIFDTGYASLDPLFDFAPWIFLFLVPALTMRLFADEKRSGTLELLYTRPLSEAQIVWGKYLAGLALVLLSLLPTLLYVIIVWRLGNPMGNIDMGGTMGSFIGLFFLAAIYAAIGTFASALSSNQVVSFLLAIVLSFVFYLGFGTLGSLESWAQAAYFIEALGIDNHYQSMSRGVIDSRDLVYFLSVIYLFVFFSQLSLRQSISKH